ncbi:unnamed protein product [Acanthoscelides obtectus]|uniref:HTH CENPB-type domain-containing protein n=1 Tax=Acanthoscelides obtectus TaxID=200917 RepID=A0A9P0JZ92_ACAOB|nr:unnamed protein product [Acanthoscelides obtectus]CAK1669672.1 Tigger transposable element-derived protein 6 [Acanthoscelides obtectus]
MTCLYNCHACEIDGSHTPWMRICCICVQQGYGSTQVLGKTKSRHQLEPEISIEPATSFKLDYHKHLSGIHASRRRYTFEEKATILRELSSKSKEVICSELGIHKRILNKWISEQGIIEKNANNEVIKNLKKQRVNLLDDAVFSWYLQVRSKGINVTGSMIRKKALSVNAEFGGNPTFSASEGWLTRWKERHHIRQLNLAATKVGTNFIDDPKEENSRDDKV